MQISLSKTLSLQTESWPIPPRHCSTQATSPESPIHRLLPHPAHRYPTHPLGHLPLVVGSSRAPDDALPHGAVRDFADRDLLGDEVDEVVLPGAVRNGEVEDAAFRLRRH